jgi:hypothetical protein
MEDLAGRAVVVGAFSLAFYAGFLIAFSGREYHSTDLCPCFGGYSSSLTVKGSVIDLKLLA